MFHDYFIIIHYLTFLFLIKLHYPNVMQIRRNTLMNFLRSTLGWRCVISLKSGFVIKRSLFFHCPPPKHGRDSHLGPKVNLSAKRRSSRFQHTNFGKWVGVCFMCPCPSVLLSELGAKTPRIIVFLPVCLFT